MADTSNTQRGPAAHRAETPSAGSTSIPPWLGRGAPEPADPDLEPIFAELVEAVR